VPTSNADRPHSGSRACSCRLRKPFDRPDVRSGAPERIDAARAGATLAQQRLDAEQRRYDAGLSTTFLVTQAQRDLLQAQVNLLQTTLDYESALVNFEAVQQAPAGTSGDTLGIGPANVVPLPTPAPQGLFRQGSAAAF